MGGVEDGDAEQDGGHAQGEGGEGAEGDEPLAVCARHLEGGDEHGEDEHVVEREGTLDQVDGGVGAGGVGAVEQTEPQRGEQPEREPGDAPQHGSVGAADRSAALSPEGIGDDRDLPAEGYVEHCQDSR